MSSPTITREQPLHIVFFPSPNMGHLTPFLRLAALLASRDCKITLITTTPNPCAEDSALISTFLTCHPHVKTLELQILHENSFNSSVSDDAFILQVNAMNRSVHLLPPLLSSLPQPISAIFSDFVVSATLPQITASLNIPIYIVSTTSARCFSMVAYLPTLLSNFPTKLKQGFGEIEIPGLASIPRSIIPPSWLDDSVSNRLLRDCLVPNAKALSEVQGLLLNSFNWFEQETIGALLDGKSLSDLPPLYPIGPLEPYELEKAHGFPWMDQQTNESVVYVNFGLRTTLSKDQTKELGEGLVRSGYPFLWVLRPNSKDESDALFLEKITKDKGMVIRELVNQPGILAHPAIGGFINPCEWVSVTDAVREGVPILAWPQHGDHKMNAEVVEKAGTGVWVKSWGSGGEKLVRGEEIGERVKQLMGDKCLRGRAREVGSKARAAFAVGGSSENALRGVIEMLKKREG
ncbi:hypothetical protein NMG60_11004959 [Bertholletia excelsa]